MYVKPQIKKLIMYAPGKSVGGIKLSSNENPLGASPKVKDVMNNFKSFSRYPDGGATSIKEKVAEFLQLDTGQFIFGAGADEVIQMISRGILSPGDNIIQADPTFTQYEHHAIIEGAQTKKIPLKDGVHDLDAMLQAIDEKTKIIWVCNPNNPTGTYLNETALKAFLDAVPAEIIVVVDEAYVEYASAQDFPDTLSFLEKHPNLMVLRTFSKIYGLASFRIGFGIGNAQFIKDLEASRLPFNTSSIAQEAALAALSDQSFVKDCAKENAAGLSQYAEFLDENSVSYYPSQANFLFIPCAHNIGMEIDKKLKDAGYIIRLFPSGIRITIGEKADNDGVIACLKENLDLLKNK